MSRVVCYVPVCVPAQTADAVFLGVQCDIGRNVHKYCFVCVWKSCDGRWVYFCCSGRVGEVRRGISYKTQQVASRASRRQLSNIYLSGLDKSTAIALTNERLRGYYMVPCNFEDDYAEHLAVCISRATLEKVFGYLITLYWAQDHLLPAPPTHMLAVLFIRCARSLHVESVMNLKAVVKSFDKMTSKELNILKNSIRIGKTVDVDDFVGSLPSCVLQKDIGVCKSTDIFISALRLMTTDAYEETNKLSRKIADGLPLTDDDKDYDDLIRILHLSLARMPKVTGNFKVYRGVDFFNPDWKVGFSDSFSQLTSFSKIESIANNFARGGESATIFRASAKGSVDISSISTKKSEEEVVFSNQHRFTITKVRKVGGIYKVNINVTTFENEVKLPRFDSYDSSKKVAHSSL